MVVYYSGWLEPFQVGFATTAAHNGAVPLVQMNPTGTSVAAIAAGRYDSYLSAYAEAVRAYHHPVILSFGHEMNGYWYSWGYTHTSPQYFVAAWRHIVTLFRTLGAQNVTWLWTINTIHKTNKGSFSGPWWPGNSYVNWVGIDGYFTNSSSVFASVFGPTIVYVRSLTHDPILIAETSATPAASQPAKIADLFAGVHLYSLLGFVWFDSVDKVDWRLSSPAAIAAFRRNAEMYQGLHHERSPACDRAPCRLPKQKHPREQPYEPDRTSVVTILPPPRSQENPIVTLPASVDKLKSILASIRWPLKGLSKYGLHGQ